MAFLAFKTSCLAFSAAINAAFASFSLASFNFNIAFKRDALWAAAFFSLSCISFNLSSFLFACAIFAFKAASFSAASFSNRFLLSFANFLILSFSFFIASFCSRIFCLCSCIAFLLASACCLILSDCAFNFCCIAFILFAFSSNFLACSNAIFLFSAPILSACNLSAFAFSIFAFSKAAAVACCLALYTAFCLISLASSFAVFNASFNLSAASLFCSINFFAALALRDSIRALSAAILFFICASFFFIAESAALSFPFCFLTRAFALDKAVFLSRNSFLAAFNAACVLALSSKILVFCSLISFFKWAILSLSVLNFKNAWELLTSFPSISCNSFIFFLFSFSISFCLLAAASAACALSCACFFASNSASLFFCIASILFFWFFNIISLVFKAFAILSSICFLKSAFNFWDSCLFKALIIFNFCLSFSCCFLAAFANAISFFLIFAS